MTALHLLSAIAPEAIGEELLSWLVYLQRGSVLLQLAVVIGLPLLIRRLRANHGAPLKHHPNLQSLIGPLLMLLISTGFLLLQWPGGLIRYFALLWLGWNLFTPLKTLLLHFNSTFPVEELETTFLKPVYVILATLSFIRLMGSLENLARIPVANLFGVELSLGKIYTAIVAVYIILTVASRPAAFMAWISGKIFGVKEQNRKGMELLFRYSVIGIGLLAVAYYVGINGNAFIAIAGGLSVGIGFGIKEIISNFISSIWLLFEGSVRPGEILMINGDPCTVRKLGLRATQLRRGRDGAELLIPNQTFFTQEATSFTATETSRRDSVDVGAAYHHDPEQVVRVLEAVAAEHHQVLDYPPPQAFVTDFADSSVNYRLLFWVRNPLLAFSVGSDLRRAIWTRFEREGITIPFPQSQVYPMQWPPAQETSLGLTGSGGVMAQGELPEATGRREEPSGESQPEAQ